MMWRTPGGIKKNIWKERAVWIVGNRGSVGEKMTEMRGYPNQFFRPN
jgi:hypothetical protein